MRRFITAAAMVAWGVGLGSLWGCAECERALDCAVQEICEEGVCQGVPPPEDTGGENPNGQGRPPTVTAGTGEGCANTAGCEAGLECVGTFCVGTGVQRVSMVFDSETDMDLHLRFPSGSEIYYGHRTEGDGELDVDQCIGAPEIPCGAGSHVENIFFSAAPAPGAYTIRAQNFNGGNAANFTIEVAGLVGNTFSGSVTATAGDFKEFPVTF